MAKLNCWEYWKCSREPGGRHVSDMGPCPAAMPNPKVNGINSGREAGRICWAVAGTFCGGMIQGDQAQKRLSCMTCEFFHLVDAGEAGNFRLEIPAQDNKH